MKTSFKKLTCLFLSILMIMSVAITGVSAATVDENPTSADTVYVDLSEVASIGSNFFIWKWPKDGSGSWYTLTNVTGDVYSFEMSTNDNFIVAAFPSTTTMPDSSWSGKEAQTTDINDYTGAHNTVIISIVDGSLGYQWADFDGSVVSTTTPTTVQTLPSRTAPTATTQTTEPADTIPTFATEADENEFLYVAAQSNLDVYGVKTKTTGREVTVTYSLTADQIIDGGQAVITYDYNVLSLSSKNTAESMFPVAKGVAYNLKADQGQIMFNFSTTNNDFTQGGAFVSLVFDVKYEGTVGQTDVWMEVTDLTSKDTTYVEDGVVASTTGITVSTVVSEVEVAEPTAPTPVATDAETNIDVRVTSNLNDTVTDIKVDKANVVVTFDVKAAEPIAFGDAVVTFDDSILALEDFYNTNETMFTTLSSGVSYNLNAAQGTMKFAFTGVDAANNKGLFDFTNGGALVTLVFTVKAGSTGRADINLNVNNLGSMSKDYIEDSLINSTVELNVAASAEEATTSATAPTKPVIATGESTTGPINVEPTESSSVTESTAPTTESTQPTETESTEPTDDTEPVTKAPTMKLKAKKIKAGQTTQAVVSNANGEKVTYTSTNTKVASVNKNGVVTGLAKGKAKIKATIGDKTITKKVKVKTNPVLKNGKKKVANNQTITVAKGKSLTLNITGKAAKIKNIVKNSKKSVAKVTSKAKQDKVTVKAKKKGTTTLTITINKAKTYKVKIKVK